MVIIKGSHERISSMSLRSSVPSDFHSTTEAYATDAYYVLAIGTRELPRGGATSVASIKAMPVTTARSRLTPRIHIANELIFVSLLDSATPQNHTTVATTF